MEMNNFFLKLGHSKISAGISIDKVWEQGSDIVKKTPEFRSFKIKCKKSAFCNKNECIEDLSNDKQLYKLFGFMRKRTLTMQQLKEDILKENPTTHVLTYLSKRSAVSVLYVDPNINHIELIEYEDNTHVQVFLLENSKLILHGVTPRQGLKEYVERNWVQIPSRKLKKLS